MRIETAEDVRALPEGRVQVTSKNGRGEKGVEILSFTSDEAVEMAQKLLTAKVDLNNPETTSQGEVMAMAINHRLDTRFEEAFAI